MGWDGMGWDGMARLEVHLVADPADGDDHRHRQQIGVRPVQVQLRNLPPGLRVAGCRVAGFWVRVFRGFRVVGLQGFGALGFGLWGFEASGLSGFWAFRR